MVNELHDIATLENVLIALQEGAGDEKRMAIYALESMLERKTRLVEKFEKQAEAV